MTKKKPAPRHTHTPRTGFELGLYCVKLFKKRLAAGVYRDDPTLEAALTIALEHGLDPIVPITEIMFDPRNSPETRGALASKLMPFRHREQSLLMKHDEAAQDHSITIVVAPFAAAQPPTPVLPGPEPVDHEEAAHGGMKTPPTPMLSDRERLRRQVAAQRETVVVEVPASPDQQPHVIGRMHQGKPYEMSADEKQRIMETLQRGPQ